MCVCVSGGCMCVGGVHVWGGIGACVEGGGACVVDTRTVLFSSVALYQHPSLQLASVSLADDDLEESPTSLVFFDLKTGSKVILQSPTADVKTTWWKKMSHLVKAISTTTKTASLARTGEDLHLLDLYVSLLCCPMLLSLPSLSGALQRQTPQCCPSNATPASTCDDLGFPAIETRKDGD